jgi:hypothetical protein
LIVTHAIQVCLISTTGRTAGTTILGGRQPNTQFVGIIGLEAAGVHSLEETDRCPSWMAALDLSGLSIRNRRRHRLPTDDSQLAHRYPSQALEVVATLALSTVPGYPPISHIPLEVHQEIRLTVRRLLALVVSMLAFPSAAALSATVLFCPFDSLEGWSVRSVGAARAAITERSEGDHSVAVSAANGTVLLSRELPVEGLCGSRVTVGCLVKAEEVVRGPQQTSMAKLHLAVASSSGIQRFAARLEGSSEWNHQGFTADVPADATRAVLNLGLEGCSGRAWFDRLIVKNDRRGVYPLDISPAINAAHSQLGITAFPEGTIEWQGIPLKIVDEIEHDAGDCLRLKGLDHPDWPPSTAAAIPVGRSATAIYILHGALGGREKSPTPCAMWTARFVGGHDSGLSVFEGRQIGAIGQTEDLDEWQVAWRGEDDDGNPVTFGVTRWTLYASEPILELSCRAYHGASPVVLAVTVVEEASQPEPEPMPGEYDEMGGGSGDAGINE